MTDRDAREADRRRPARDASLRAALLLLEIAATLLTVLAGRAVLLSAAMAPAELVAAAGLWAAVLATACSLPERE